MKKVVSFILALSLWVIPGCGSATESSAASSEAVASTPVVSSEATEADASSVEEVTEADASSVEEVTEADASSVEEVTEADVSSVEEAASEIDAIGGIDVEQGLFDVTITVPADYIGETTQDELDEGASAGNYQSATLNGDGSVTYVMSKAQHQMMMDNTAASINEALAEMVDSEEYPSFTAIDANEDFTEYTVTMSSSELGFNEELSVMVFSMYTGMYHAFNGTEVNDVHVMFVNEETGETIEDWYASEAAS